MDVELLPHVGVATFRLGMSVEEGKRAARELGLPATRADAEAEPGQVLFTHDEFRMNFVLGFAKGELVNVEVWRFRNEDADVRVTLEGLDVFRTPSEELLQQLEERGHTAEENDLGFDALPDLKVIFANDSSYEYPVDEDGDPLYFDYVLVTSVFGR
ncbi:hypothetical protein OHT93_31585 [Streptomyces sp. NBC_00191]|uniref:hypothetical protein n=1 Tax=Streptomyces sp. NBC_00191 TaxID=2975674 RepID=UPI003247C124